MLDVGPPQKRHHLLMSPPLGHPVSSTSLGLHSSLPLRLEEYALPREFRERDRLSLDREYRHYGNKTINSERDFWAIFAAILTL